MLFRKERLPDSSLVDDSRICRPPLVDPHRLHFPFRHFTAVQTNMRKQTAALVYTTGAVMSVVRCRILSNLNIAVSFSLFFCILYGTNDPSLFSRFPLFLTSCVLYKAVTGFMLQKPTYGFR